MQRLLNDKTGAAALEFAILAPIFFSVLFSSFEAGWLVTKSTLLERALDATIREVRVGSAGGSLTQLQIETMICNRMYVVPDCAANLTVEMTRIQTAADFPSSSAQCVDRTKSVKPAVSFTPGSRADIMYVRACLVTDALTPYIGLALAFNLDPKGGYSITSSSAFMNEPSD